MKCLASGWNKNGCLLTLKQNVLSSPLLLASTTKKINETVVCTLMGAQAVFHAHLIENTEVQYLLSKCIVLCISVVTEDRLRR